MLWLLETAGGDRRKPYLLRHLLNLGFTTAIFLDADILVLDSLQPLFDDTCAHAIALTPHLLTPLSGVDRWARDLNILQSGVYNGGFIGISEHESARDSCTGGPIACTHTAGMT